MIRHDEVKRPLRRVLPYCFLPLVLAPTTVLTAQESRRAPEGITRRVTLTLVTNLSSRLPDGTSFAAELKQPFNVNSTTLLPVGTRFEGKVRSQQARRLNRSGWLRLVFGDVRLPDGTVRCISAFSSDIEKSGLRVDSEGTIHPRLTKRRVVLELGAVLLIGKVADDTAEIIITGLGVGAARYIGMGSGLAFLLIQKGKEIKIPQGTKIELTLDDEQVPCEQAQVSASGADANRSIEMAGLRQSERSEGSPDLKKRWHCEVPRRLRLLGMAVVRGFKHPQGRLG